MENTLTLDKAIEYAKKFENFEDVLKAVQFHPEFLTEIPETRRWAILHHIVLSGDVNHLEQVLSSQKINKNFTLLTKTKDNLTVLDISKLCDNQTEMLKRVEKLVALDRMLNYADTKQWDQCFEIVRMNPAYGNQKPSYRKYYLIHYIACANEMNQFERFKKIENFQFNLTLRVDRKKINVIAREANCNDFATYIEKNHPTYFDPDDIDNRLYEPSEQAKTHTQKINAIMVHCNIAQEPEPLLAPLEKPRSRMKVDEEIRSKLSAISKTNTVTTPSKQNKDTILSILTCSLTHAIVTDPVVAADGFTYERTAIEDWLKTNECSPMTNEKLAHKNLNPNFIVKRILESITQQ